MKIAASKPASGKSAVNSVALACPIAVNKTGKRKMDRNAGNLPKHRSRGKRQNPDVVGVEGPCRDQQGDEYDGKTGDAEPSLADPRRDQRTDPAGNRGDDVECKRYQIGAQDARNSNHHE